MTQRNEAAERLRQALNEAPDLQREQMLDAALAEERRHVIEQIREWAEHGYTTKSLFQKLDDLSLSND